MGLKRKTKKYIKKHEEWQKHAKGELAKGRQPTKFKDYKTETGYYGVKTQSTESRLKAAGITGKELRRLKGK